MKVLLVVPSAGYRNKSVSLGICYVASYALKHNPNLDIRIVDFGLELYSRERLLKDLQQTRPDILGVTCTVSNYPNAVEIVRFVKNFDPKILTLMGGPMATAIPEDCLKHCDVVVRGEGELTFNEIVQGKDLESVKGISFVRNGKMSHNPPRDLIKDLDGLPPPYNVYHLLKIKEYPEYQTEKGMHVMGSRGCPFNCTFCFSAVLWGRRIRFRSPRNIVDEIEYLHNKYDCLTLSFNDDDLNLPNPKRTIQICDEIIARGLNRKMRFFAQLRVNKQLVSKEMFQRMREANFTGVGFGVESGSQQVLNSMRKSITIKEIKDAVKMARDNKIKPLGFFIVGNWNESLLDIYRTWKLIMDTKMIPSFQMAIPLPETELHHIMKRNGFLTELDWSQTRQTLPDENPFFGTNRMSKSQVYITYRFIKAFFFFKVKLIDRVESPFNFRDLGRYLSALISRSWRLFRKVNWAISLD